MLPVFFRHGIVLALTIYQKLHIKLHMLVILLIKYHNNIHECIYLLRAAVVHPSLSPWRYLHDQEDDGSFLHLTGLTREAFCIFQDIMFPPKPLDEFGQRPCGRPKLLDNTSSVGLLLFYIWSMMTYKHLCMIFGILTTQCSTYIDVILLLTTDKLCDHPLSQV
jgi:hypothetical protein